MEMRKGMKQGRTYTSAISAIALVAHGSFTDDFAVRVGMVVGFDIAGAYGRAGGLELAIVLIKKEGL